jgi:hypothetical protein
MLETNSERNISIMHLNLKMRWFNPATLLILFLASYSTPAATPETLSTETAIPAVQTLKTSIGEFEIASARLVDEVHDTKAPEGMKFMLISLTGLDSRPIILGEFDLEDFQKMINEEPGGVRIVGDDGSETRYTQMGGWLDDEFLIGFTVTPAKTYTLKWGDSVTIPLDVES